MNQRVVPYICKHNDDCSYCYINIVLNIRKHNCQSLLVSVKRKSLQLYIKDYKKHLNSQIINGIYKWFTLLILMTIIDNQRWPWSPKTSQSIRAVFSVFNASTRSAITSTAYWFFAYRYSQLWYIYNYSHNSHLTHLRASQFLASNRTGNCLTTKKMPAKLNSRHRRKRNLDHELQYTILHL